MIYDCVVSWVVDRNWVLGVRTREHKNVTRFSKRKLKPMKAFL